MEPRATIIVVTWNSARYFERLKASLEAQTAPFRLIVVDNASGVRERPKSGDFPVYARIFQNETNVGFAAANNFAAQQTDTEFLVLLNPDAFPESDWLARLIAAADTYPGAGAFGSTQISATDPSVYDGLGDCYHASGLPWRSGYGISRLKLAPRTGEVMSACAAAALYRSDLWQSLDGFDERFFCYCEDVELGMRIWLTGRSVIQVAEAIVYHVGGGSSSQRSDFSVRLGTRNRLWTFLKVMPTPLLFLLAPAHIAITLLFLVISPFRGTGRATWSGVAEALACLGEVVRDRGHIQARRRLSTIAFARLLAWTTFPLISKAPVIRDPGPSSY